MGKNIEDVDVSVEVTGGPTLNIQLIQNGDMDLGFVTSWMGGEGYNGEGWTEEEHDKIRSMFIMYPSVMNMYALKGNGIEEIRYFQSNLVSTGAQVSYNADTGLDHLQIIEITI